MTNLGVPPHCPTCQCVSQWTGYSVHTFGWRQCAGCGQTTERPGLEDWAWRPRPPTRRGRGQGRATESACPTCAHGEAKTFR